jgi:hypothetical protein
VDYVRVAGGGRHELRVSVIDPAGTPIPDLPFSAFRVEADGGGVEDLRVEPWSRRYPDQDLAVLVDEELLASPALELVRDLVGRLGDEAGGGDRLAVAAVGGRRRWLEGPASQARELAHGLETLAGTGGDEGLYDALFEAARRASRRGGRTSGAVLLVTTGRDLGSRHAMLDVLALQQARGRGVAVLVVLVGGRGAPEEERLSRLAVRSGGALVQASTLAGAPGAAERLRARLRGGYAVGFRSPRWDAEAERHTVTVTVERGGLRAQAAREFAAADVLEPAWWSRPLLWLTLALLAALGLAAFLLLRPRLLGRLVVRAGEEKGCWYEIYAYPITVGAAEGNDLVFPDGRVSRNHAVFERNGRNVELLDLNSENGTFVNGDRVTRRRLVSGDRVGFGGAVELTYEGRA